MQQIIKYTTAYPDIFSIGVCSGHPGIFEIKLKETVQFKVIVYPGRCSRINTHIKLENPYGIKFSCIHYSPENCKDILIWLEQDEQEHLIYTVANFSLNTEYEIWPGDVIIDGYLPIDTEILLEEGSIVEKNIEVKKETEKYDTTN